MRRATGFKIAYSSYQKDFNPRSPWGERPFPFLSAWAGGENFNPRSPWGERLISFFSPCSSGRFQSTLSVRRATGARLHFYPAGFNFNPRSPWGERQTLTDTELRLLLISIHALREESDCFLLFCCSSSSDISIHALREESDAKKISCRRPQAAKPLLFSAKFQSTLSVRRATISRLELASGRRNFNPRSPWGERLV